MSNFGTNGIFNHCCPQITDFQPLHFSCDVRTSISQRLDRVFDSNGFMEDEDAKPSPKIRTTLMEPVFLEKSQSLSLEQMRDNLFFSQNQMEMYPSNNSNGIKSRVQVKTSERESPTSTNECRENSVSNIFESPNCGSPRQSRRSTPLEQSIFSPDEKPQITHIIDLGGNGSSNVKGIHNLGFLGYGNRRDDSTCLDKDHNDKCFIWTDNRSNKIHETISIENENNYGKDDINFGSPKHQFKPDLGGHHAPSCGKVMDLLDEREGNVFYNSKYSLHTSINSEKIKGYREFDRDTAINSIRRKKEESRRNTPLSLRTAKMMGMRPTGEISRDVGCKSSKNTLGSAYGFILRKLEELNCDIPSFIKTILTVSTSNPKFVTAQESFVFGWVSKHHEEIFSAIPSEMLPAHYRDQQRSFRKKTMLTSENKGICDDNNDDGNNNNTEGDEKGGTGIGNNIVRIY